MTTKPRGTVLYVDDDEANRHLLSELFRTAGFTVQEAATGSEALRLAAEQPDLIILDVQLPDIDGFEVCRRIKAHPATGFTPVLHLSAVHITPEEKAHALDEGADGYLTKPVEPSELIAHAQALVRIHQVEERSRKAARDWQRTFDAINDGLFLLDRRGRVQRCNRAMARLLEKDVREIVGRGCEELMPGPRGFLGALAFRRMLETHQREVIDFELEDRRLQAAADPLLEPDGSLGGAVFMLSDVSERRQLEEHVRRSQRMDSLGRLAAGVVHDFNNLLTVITSNVGLLLKQGPGEGSESDALRAIDQAAWRAAELTRQLLDFARWDSTRLRPTRLEDCLDEAGTILRGALGPGVVLEFRVAPGLWAIQADAGRISQVLMNLALNARDAMPAGGTLVLEAENVVVDLPQGRLANEARPGEFVRLRVADSGRGIPPDVQAHIFEPFFTTKPRGSGSGLGLAQVFGIMRQHGGWIECSSAEGEGTCFDLFFARSEWAEMP